MKRDLKKLSTDHFDVLVIGGGIQGATLAFELSRSGFYTALIEQNDFGAETSANSLKILHGGLRYLQYLNVKRIWKFIHSRRRLMGFAPNLIRPLPCVIPTVGHGIQGKELLQLALWLNDLIGHDRNRGMAEEHSLPRGSILTKGRTLALFPVLYDMEFNGGMLWYDDLALDTERLVLEFIKRAYQKGACLANYVRVEKLLIHDKNVFGVSAKDRYSDDVFKINAYMVINAAGPWFEKILHASGAQSYIRQKWAKGINIVLQKSLSQTHALGLQGIPEYHDSDAVLNKGARFFFFVPWQGSMMAGTHYERYDGDPDSFRVTPSDLTAFFNQISAVLPKLNLSKKDVTHFHGGLVPVQDAEKKRSLDIQPDKHASIMDHEKVDGFKGLISIKSVKFTTAWHSTLQIKRLLARKKFIKRRGAPLLKEGMDEEDREIKNIGIETMDPDVLSRFKGRYGSDLRSILNYIQEKNLKISVICQESRLTDAEVLFSIEKEMALHLADIVFRRSGIGSAKCPSPETLNRISAVMGEKLGWSDACRKKEIQDVLDRYHPLSQI